MGNSTDKISFKPAGTAPQQKLSNYQQQKSEQQSYQQYDITDFILKKISDLADPAQEQQYQSLYLASIKNQQTDRALGCIFGSLIGDALGAFCEFSQLVDQKLLNRAMAMPGGGVFSLKPGQFTDDSQMASHLLQALTKFQPNIPLKEQTYTLLKHIALEYLQWLKSDPFDIGITCRKGLNRIKNNEQALRNKPEQLQSTFAKIFKQVDQDNKDSQSNGSLMRIAPMAVFLSSLNQDPLQHKFFITSEIKMIHPKLILQNAGLLWVNTLCKVIKRKDDNPKTFQAIFKEVQNTSEGQQTSNWFDKAKEQKFISGKVNIGWAKIAWSYGMNCLYQLSTSVRKLDENYYRKVIRSVIKQAGDTDTNAAIVGGLLGAIVGFSNLPTNYLHTMLSLMFETKDTEEDKVTTQQRPSNYQPFQVLLKTLDLFKLTQQSAKSFHPSV